MANSNMAPNMAPNVANKNLEIIKSDKTSYGFTLRKTSFKQGTPNIEMYEEYLKKVSNLGCIVVHKVYEYTSGLHVHGVITVPKKLNKNRFRIRGWNMRLDELYDELGWIQYTMKDQPDTEEQVPPEHDIAPLRKKIFTIYSINGVSQIQEKGSQQEAANADEQKGTRQSENLCQA